MLTAQDKADIAAEVNVPVTDVQVNGTSVINNGVANIPIAGSDPGVVKVFGEAYGVQVSNGILATANATDAQVLCGSNSFRPIVPATQHSSTFYGLAKAAGDITQPTSNNAIGTYTENAQSKIHEMLDAPVTVSGTDPVISGKAGIRYVCGTVDTLTLTPPASGIIDVVFTSGTTPTVLTVTPPSGKTMLWPGWFNPSALDASAVYEINIMDGNRGAVMMWT